MTNYQVELSYTYDIEAESKEKAEAMALEQFGDAPPYSDEMNIRTMVNNKEV